MSLLIVGTVAFDGIETPYGKVDQVIGGSANYFAWAASYLTRPIRLMSIIGDDYPEEEIQLLESRGIDTEGLERISGAKSFYWAGKYKKNLNDRDTLTTDLNVLSQFDPRIPRSYQNSQVLMLGNLTPSTQLSIIRQFIRRPRIIAMDTMNYWMNTEWDVLMDVLLETDVLIINDEEARQMSGETALVLAASRINEMGPKIVAVKKGEHGAFLFFNKDGKQRIFFAPALPLARVVDPTGAGDTFAGGFMGYLTLSNELTFDNLKRAMIFGSAMASFCVEDFSLRRLKNLSDTEIRSRIEEFKELVNFDFPARD